MQHALNYITALYYRIARLKYYEYWPAWLFYAPVVWMYTFLAIKHRSLMLPSIANPSITSGAIIGESKSEIYDLLPVNHKACLKTTLLTLSDNPHNRIRDLRQFMHDYQLSLPIILKPNIGQRGRGVRKILSFKEAESYLKNAEYDVIVQEYAEYEQEAGIFYVKNPKTNKSFLFSMTKKAFPVVLGDGKSTISQLILSHATAKYVSSTYFNRFADRLDTVLPKGTELKLVESGNHAQGAVFIDGKDLGTKELKASLDKLTSNMHGFYIGRFDVRYESDAYLKQGKRYKIIEINGAAAEATHIYDRRISLLEAYKTLWRQWSMVFQTGAFNRKSQKPRAILTFVKDMLKYRRLVAGYPVAS